jgi:hypothetical protein
MMTRKHFRMIADWLIKVKKTMPMDMFEELMSEVMENLKKENANFSETKFLAWVHE